MAINTEILGYTGAILTTCAFLPQVILALRTEDLSSISLPMYVIFVSGVACWLAYGILLHIYPIVAANALTFILAGIVLALKVRSIMRHERIDQS
jgi:MtN3 and saliva related transmembrane protein